MVTRKLYLAGFGQDYQTVKIPPGKKPFRDSKATPRRGSGQGVSRGRRGTWRGAYVCKRGQLHSGASLVRAPKGNSSSGSFIATVCILLLGSRCGCSFTGR